MCSKEEEPLVLQQFLRFGETRPITQQLLMQELTDRHNEEHRIRAQQEIKKLIERNAMAAAAATARTTPPTTPLLPGGAGGHNGGLAVHAAAAAAVAAAAAASENSKESSINSSPPRSSSTPPPPPVTTTCSSSAVGSPPPLMPASKHISSSPKHSPYISSSPSVVISTASVVNGTAPATSPLNRLQNMQPFDYRNSKPGSTDSRRATSSPIERPVPPTIAPGMRMPPGASAAAMAGLGLPLLPTVSGVPASFAASYHNTIASMANKVIAVANPRPINFILAIYHLATFVCLQANNAAKSEDGNALNLSSPHHRCSGGGVEPRHPPAKHGQPSRGSFGEGTGGGGGGARGKRKDMSNDTGSSKKANLDDGIQQVEMACFIKKPQILNRVFQFKEIKKKLRDNIGISYVSPTTGKKRVQCNVCLKTF